MLLVFRDGANYHSSKLSVFLLLFFVCYVTHTVTTLSVLLALFSKIFNNMLNFLNHGRLHSVFLLWTFVAGTMWDFVMYCILIYIGRPHATWLP